MAIRWVSTPESIKANQPSVLAIVETLAAMGIAIWIAVTWDTYIHIAVGAMIAPMLLMRTDESCIRAANYSDWIRRKLEDSTTDFLVGLVITMFILVMTAFVMRYTAVFRGYTIVFFIAFLMISLTFFSRPFVIARFASWFVTLVRSPGPSIAAISGNWKNMTVVLDSRQEPHILHPPGKIPYGLSDEDFPTPRRFLAAGFEVVQSGVILSALMVFGGALIFPFAYTYRWSLKSTALIWFPLLWGMRSTKEASGPLQPSLDIYRRDPVTKIVLGISVAAVAGFIIKIVLFSTWAGFVEWWNEGQLRETLSLYVAPAEIPRWQLAIAINAAIAIVMYILAGRWLVRLEHGRLTDETWPRRVFQAGLFIRPILSCYTIACTLYITSIAAWDLEWPALGEQWFPWQ